LVLLAVEGLLAVAVRLHGGQWWIGRCGSGEEEIERVEEERESEWE
jgi:hypothetical protein